MVQACQTSQHQGGDNPEVQSSTDSTHLASHNSMGSHGRYDGTMEHIILRRPHTALLLSTIPG